MKKDSAKKLLKDWWKPVFLEVLKGAAKAVGFYFIAHFLKQLEGVSADKVDTLFCVTATNYSGVP